MNELITLEQPPQRITRPPGMLLHCGAEEVDRRTVYDIPTPTGTYTWYPLGLIHEVESQLTSAGFHAGGESHAFSHEGARYFGLFEVKTPGTGERDYTWTVGIRNSHDKTCLPFVLRKNLRSGYTQSYNAQAGVDTEGSQLIVGNRISQSAGNRAELEPGVDSIAKRTGKPTSVSTDAGYVNGDMIERVQSEAGVEVYCSVHREDAHSERHYDYRPKKKPDRKPKAIKDKRLIEMGEKLKTEEGAAKSPETPSKRTNLESRKKYPRNQRRKARGRLNQ